MKIAFNIGGAVAGLVTYKILSLCGAADSYCLAGLLVGSWFVTGPFFLGFTLDRKENV